MPTNDYFRERLIRVIRSETKPISRTVLLRQFGTSARDQVNNIIGDLLSNGVFVKLGLGKRGSPEKILAGPNFPARKCPFCLRDMPEDFKKSDSTAD